MRDNAIIIWLVFSSSLRRVGTAFSLARNSTSVAIHEWGAVCSYRTRAIVNKSVHSVQTFIQGISLKNCPFKTFVSFSIVLSLSMLRLLNLLIDFKTFIAVSSCAVFADSVQRPHRIHFIYFIGKFLLSLFTSWSPLLQDWTVFFGWFIWKLHVHSPQVWSVSSCVVNYSFLFEFDSSFYNENSYHVVDFFDIKCLTLVAHCALKHSHTHTHEWKWLISSEHATSDIFCTQNLVM